MVKRILGIIMIVCMLCNCVGCKNFSKQEVKSEDMNRLLKVHNGKLVNGYGETVVLRGINLGGWLIQESWMCPVNGEDRAWANLDTLTILEERFTKNQVQELIDTYQDHWIVEDDIRIISEMGCNVVRVPFWYRNFMQDENGTWIDDNLNQNPGFQRLDWIIEMAKKYGLYVILDMHGCPGGQSMDHCSGTLGQNRLYIEETCQNTMEKLWVEIAKRYKDNPTVAAYDIMNEPQNNAGYTGEYSYDPWQSESWELSNQLYDRMIKAIREIDENHVITVEGIWRVSNLPDPADMGWTNMMYQTHLYDNDKDFQAWVNAMAETVETYGVAGYIGEFENLAGLNMCNEQEISWTTWTYKGTNKDLGNFFCYYGNVERADTTRDSFDTIKEKWGEVLETKNFKEKVVVTSFLKLYSDGKIVGKVY